jgi:head-tail adaptor
MALLTTTDLAALRRDAAAALTTTAVIQRRTASQDALGGPSESWADLATVTALVLAQPGDESELAGRVAGQFVYTIRLPAGTDVAVEDRLVTGGRTLEVVGVAVPKSYEVLRAVRAIEVR